VRSPKSRSSVPTSQSHHSRPRILQRATSHLNVSMKSRNQHDRTRLPLAVPWLCNTVDETREVLVRWKNCKKLTKRKRCAGPSPPCRKKGAACQGRHQREQSRQLIASLTKKLKRLCLAVAALSRDELQELLQKEFGSSVAEVDQRPVAGTLGKHR
jgi:hypothetical protein